MLTPAHADPTTARRRSAGSAPASLRDDLMIVGGLDEDISFGRLAPWRTADRGQPARSRTCWSWTKPQPLKAFV
jgi:hypothetical protein